MAARRLGLLLAGALALRLILLPLPDPYPADLTTFWLPWMAYGAEHGLAQLYRGGQPPVNYPPLFLALLVGLGKLYALWVPSFAYSPWQSVLIKLPAVLADLGIALLLYRVARRLADDAGVPPTAREDRSFPLLAAALWALNPAALYVSAFWAQVDSIPTLWMLAALVAALAQRWGWSGLLLGLALLTKLQAVVVAPLLLLLAWMGGPRAVLRWAAGGAGVVALWLLPFWASGALGPLLGVYLGAVGHYPALSLNAYNAWFVVQWVSGRWLGAPLDDTARVLGPITLRWVGLALLAGYTALVLWPIWRWRRRLAAPGSGHPRRVWLAPDQRVLAFFAAGMLVFGFFSLATEMHERYVLPALAFLALPAARDRRVLLPYLLLTAVVSYNLVAALPWGLGIARLLESLPGGWALASLATLGLFIWLTVLYGRYARRGVAAKEAL